jgi:hypothetical protein
MGQLGICHAGLFEAAAIAVAFALNSPGVSVMPNRFLCPKCHGQRTTSCAACGGTGKRSIVGIPIGACKECDGGGHRRCDVCGGTGEIERQIEHDSHYRT